jgi:hypothetical protein
MKRIITETEETVSLCSISDSSIVGIEWELGDRAMIISTREGFCALTNRHKPNIYNVWYADSTQEYIEKALTQGNNTKSKAFVFDTPFELYEWMSKYE